MVFRQACLNILHAEILEDATFAIGVDSWRYQPLQDLPSLVVGVELVDEVVVVERKHSVQGSQEVPLIDFHHWLLDEDVLLLGPVVLFEYEGGQGPDVPADLPWDERVQPLAAGLI